MMGQKKHLYLIDGSGFIFRAFHALPPLTRADGTSVNAVLGFCNMLYKLLEETAEVGYLAVIFDSARHNFRHEIYPAYKAHRPEPPAELIPQFSLIRDACQAFNVISVEKEGFEADDLIATYARLAVAEDMQVTIVSSDKDLMQLVKGSISMLDPLKNRKIGPAEVFEKFGVEPARVIDVQALAGDSSDGVPGVPGIGVKTAAELITTYGSLEALLERCHEIKQPKRRQTIEENKQQARISYQLVSLRDDVETVKPLEVFKREAINISSLTEFLTTQNFRTLLSRIEKKHSGHISSKDIPIGSIESNDTAAQSLIAVKPTQRIVGHYELVQTSQALQLWIDKIYKAGVVAFDTETNSLNPWHADLVGISLAVEPGHACYIPLQHKIQRQHLFDQNPSAALDQLPLHDVLNQLRPVLHNDAILKIGQNIKYDMAVLKKYDVTLAPIADTMVMSYDLDGIKNSHGMDALAELHLNHSTIRYEDVVGSGRHQITFDYVDLDRACEYAAEDADITLRLYHIFKQRLASECVSSVYHTIDLPLILVLLDMENAGVKVDIGVLNNLSLELAERLTNLETEIHQLAGQSFNIASPKQLGEILFDHLKIPGGKKSKTGAYTTGINVLEELATDGHIIATQIIEWRQLAKLKSTYTDALVQLINPNTGRLHTSYALTITSTGRLSSSNPNLQNIPIRTDEGRKIRCAFIPAPGHKFISLDYSQIELRLLAHMANIESLKIAFRHGRDIHTATAADVFDIPLESVDAEHRRRAKAINFGIIYGMSAFGLAAQLKIPRSEAAQYIMQYAQQYPGILAYMESLKQEARTHGFVKTLYGRKCYVTGINDKNPTVRAAAERQAINAPLQGTAADIIKRAMITVQHQLSEYNLKAKMLLQVHDELVFEVPDHEVDQLIKLVKASMEKVVYLSVPLTVDIGTGSNWDEAH